MRSDAYDNKRHSKFLKELLAERGLSNKDGARILKISENYFYNKLYRDSFSFDDILTIVYACGYSLALIDTYGKEHNIDPDYFPNVSTKINDYNKEVVNDKRREYKELKNKVLELEKRYGF